MSRFRSRFVSAMVVVPSLFAGVLVAQEPGQLQQIRDWAAELLQCNSGESFRSNPSVSEEASQSLPEQFLRLPAQGCHQGPQRFACCRSCLTSPGRPSYETRRPPANRSKHGKTQRAARSLAAKAMCPAEFLPLGHTSTLHSW